MKYIFILRLNCNKHLRVKDGTNEFTNEECVKVPMPAHQALSLTGYIFEASYSMSRKRVNKI